MFLQSGGLLTQVGVGRSRTGGGQFLFQGGAFLARFGEGGFGGDGASLRCRGLLGGDRQLGLGGGELLFQIGHLRPQVRIGRRGGRSGLRGGEGGFQLLHASAHIRVGGSDRLGRDLKFALQVAIGGEQLLGLLAGGGGGLGLMFRLGGSHGQLLLHRRITLPQVRVSGGRSGGGLRSDHCCFQLQHLGAEIGILGSRGRGLGGELLFQIGHLWPQVGVDRCGSRGRFGGSEGGFELLYPAAEIGINRGGLGSRERGLQLLHATPHIGVGGSNRLGRDLELGLQLTIGGEEFFGLLAGFGGGFGLAFAISGEGSHLLAQGLAGGIAFGLGGGRGGELLLQAGGLLTQVGISWSGTGGGQFLFQGRAFLIRFGEGGFCSHGARLRGRGLLGGDWQLGLDGGEGGFQFMDASTYIRVGRGGRA